MLAIHSIIFPNAVVCEVPRTALEEGLSHYFRQADLNEAAMRRTRSRVAQRSVEALM
jgi:hypothetical protein